jgi:hypothetical protein
MYRLAWYLIVVPLALAMSGCGSPQGISVQGKITKGGAKYSLPADQKLNITFYLTETIQDGARTIPAGQAYMGAYKSEDGTFNVAAPEGGGIPAGKYRVSLVQRLTREAVDKKNANLSRKQELFDRDTDMLNGDFGEKSPIVVEIKDSAPVEIDLDKYKVEVEKQKAAQRQVSVVGD